ncbi:DEAD/DEAH box helicase [Listeria monocytogenes]|nr:DEAD/DEAH box helicase [Listeria monocytogenes]
MQIPRNQTLAEALYKDIDSNEYLNEIYESLLYNYSILIFKIQKQQKRVNVKDALRFADLLAKSTIPEKRDRHKLWGQELIILLSIIYPEDSSVKYYLGSILSTVGNYRGLQSTYVEGFQTADVFDALYFEYDKSTLKIPGHEESYFFHDQKDVYDGLSSKYFSYSGPTSMGKSFVVQTYLKQQIENGSTKNYAILVPTKALINEVRSNIIGSLQEKLQETNYRVVSASGDIVLQQEHNFIFVMTPERLLHIMISMPKIKIDFLFVDEAHKISDRGGRSAYYYKVVAQLSKMKEMPTVIFASPNIPNPEVYLSLIPKIQVDEIKKLASKYAPVCQFKYFLDLCEGRAYFHNDYSKSLSYIANIPQQDELSEIVTRVGCIGHIEDKESCSMLFLRDGEIKATFTTMMNKLAFSNKLILEPLYKSISQIDEDRDRERMAAIEKRMEQLMEERNTLITLMAKGFLEPALFNQERNVIDSEMKNLSTEKTNLVSNSTSGVLRANDIKDLIDYVSADNFNGDYTEELFEEFVEFIIVNSRNELTFNLKCGLSLKEKVVR